MGWEFSDVESPYFTFPLLGVRSPMKFLVNFLLIAYLSDMTGATLVSWCMSSWSGWIVWCCKYVIQNPYKDIMIIPIDIINIIVLLVEVKVN